MGRSHFHFQCTQIEWLTTYGHYGGEMVKSYFLRTGSKKFYAVMAIAQVHRSDRMVLAACRHVIIAYPPNSCSKGIRTIYGQAKGNLCNC